MRRFGHVREVAKDGASVDIFRVIQGPATHVLRRSIAKLINRKTGKVETAQEWRGHTSTAHTRAYIDAEDYREKANGVVAGLDI
jgi:integrase